MLFNSLQYLLFLPLVVLAYWLVPGKLRTVLLLVASYYFYMSWMKSYGVLLFGLTAINYLAGLAIYKLSAEKSKRLALIAAITFNVGILALFKYTNFFLDTYNSLERSLSSFLPLNLVPAPSALPIILPLGISFFVFEFIHYLVDVRAGNKPIVNPIRFGLFAAFFPSQIAGPIKRFEDFDSQLEKPRVFDRMQFGEGIGLIVRGMFKKVCLGDNLAPLAASGFANPAMLGTVDAWVAVLAFTLQIYFDFSGYTDIGRGSALLLGYKLPENFNMPYIARSIQDFWHRWHMSLSTWLRDYLYIPLGGSRGGKFATMKNLFITMLLGGLWHGASWHFVVWGGFHGVCLAIHRVWERVVDGRPALARFGESFAGKATCWTVTFLTVISGWVLFRANNLGEAMQMFQSMVTIKASLGENLLQSFLYGGPLPAVLAMYAVFVLGSKLQLKSKLKSKLSSANLMPSPPIMARAVALAAVALFIAGLAPRHAVPFIYFQF
jgi:alginate O-acetyltransferase complex protein AlgI